MIHLFKIIFPLFLLNLNAQAADTTIRVIVKNEVASPVEGAVLEMDGKMIGRSNAKGEVLVVLSRGTHLLRAYITGFQQGMKKIIYDGVKGPIGPVELLLTKPDIEISVSSIKYPSILPLHFHHFKIALLDRNQQPLVIAGPSQVYIFDVHSGKSSEISHYFHNEAGQLVLKPNAFEKVSEILEHSGNQIRLQLRAPVRNFPIHNLLVEQDFLVGRYPMSGRIVFANAHITGGVKSMHLKFSITPFGRVDDFQSKFTIYTKPDASFELPDMPEGYIHIAVDKPPATSRAYFWDWRLECRGSLDLELYPESISELEQNRPPLRLLYKKIGQR